MMTAHAKASAVKALWPVRLLVVCCLLVLVPALPQKAAAAVGAAWWRLAAEPGLPDGLMDRRVGMLNGYRAGQVDLQAW